MAAYFDVEAHGDTNLVRYQFGRGECVAAIWNLENSLA